MQTEASRSSKAKGIAVMLIVVLLAALLLLAIGGLFNLFPIPRIPSFQVTQMPVSSVLPEIEATEYGGVTLVPIRDQGNNAVKGTRHIDRKTFELEVTGLVRNELSVSYDDLLKLPMYSEAVYMPCVEGWGFMAKWTGFRVVDLLDQADVKGQGTYVMFWSDDGYSTGMSLDYLTNNNIILAYGLNDITLPDDRGFPLQLVAKSKYGYKWAKWITMIEVLDHPELGYWEQRGYNDEAMVKGLPPG
jgi:DMSO/TMAO reductase YedYZ molybdopterin-dependent catalytic subunit